MTTRSNDSHLKVFALFSWDPSLGFPPTNLPSFPTRKSLKAVFVPSRSKLIYPKVEMLKEVPISQAPGFCRWKGDFLDSNPVREESGQKPFFGLFW